MNNFKRKTRFPAKRSSIKDNIFCLTKDAVVITLGLVISSFGTALFYAAELGSSPMATFCDGLHNLLNISYGSANTFTNMALLVVMLVVERSYINIGTVLCVFVIGPFVNLFTPFLAGMNLSSQAIPLRVLFTIIGTAFMGAGLGLYVAVDRGYGPLEGLVKYFCAKFGHSYSNVKIIQDVLLVLGGVLLSAKWGVGTLVAMVLTGPLLQFSVEFFTKHFKKEPTVIH